MGSAKLQIFLAAFFVRLIFVGMPAFKIDVVGWYTWADRLYQLGFSNFYSDTVWTNYTPGYLYILYILGFITSIFQLNEWQIMLLHKLPAILAESLLAVLIFHILYNKFSRKIAFLGSTFFIFSPAVILNSAVWGQVDGVFALPIVLSIYYLTKNRLYLSSVAFAIGFLIKPQAISLLPVFLGFLLSKLKLSNALKLILPGLVLLLVASVPFFKNPLQLINLIVEMSSDYHVNSLFAYNLWGIFGFWVEDTTAIFGISMQALGYILLFIFWILSLIFYLKKKINLYSFATLSTLAFFFLPTRVHERYLYLSLPFLVICSYWIRSKILIILTLILYFIHFLNLYYVYIYYNYFYSGIFSVLFWQPLYNFLDANGKILSIISTIVFFAVASIIIKKGNLNENQN